MRRNGSLLRMLADRELRLESLAWAVGDAEGVGDGWPAGIERGVLIVPAACLRFGTAPLPAGSRSLRGLALGFALEPGLINAPEDNLYVAADGTALVWLGASAPLAALLAELGARGLDLQHIVPDAMLLPEPPAGSWAVHADGEGWLIRLDRYRALRLPSAAAVLAGPLRDADAPQRLLCCGDGALPAVLADMPVERLAAPDWRRATLDRTVDLAPDDLQSGRHRRRWQQALRRAALAALLLCACEVGLALADSGRLLWQRASIERDMSAAAQRLHLNQAGAQILPGARAALDALRLARGLPARSGALALLDALTQTRPDDLPPLQSLEYRDGRLLFLLSAGDVRAVDGWRAALAARRVQLAADGDGRFSLGFGDAS